ncbi:hypothetical protein Cni_G26470 [Canna indica]|uniref:Pollen Ole e 1 allergen and extensin family protein n=1 Tax=Canna indica TaxID=4628 RepID=A0AAQ3L2B6_9LILI|nr:hypothetical protein Cni_G26470 [Canna indica]
MNGCLGDFILVVALLFLVSSKLGTASSLSSEETLMRLSRAELVRLAGYGEEKLSSVLVTGTVVCDACLPPGSFHFPVEGVKIGIGCRTNGESTRKTTWARGKTDDFGEFTVDLPSHLHANPRLEEDCMLRVLRVPKSSLCRATPITSYGGLNLSSAGDSVRVYSAGTLRLKPLKLSFPWPVLRAGRRRKVSWGDC